MEPSENWDHLFGELGPPCFSLKWSYLPDKVVPIARMARFCRTIGTTLSDNWNHLVIQMKTLAGETSSCLGGKVESQESRVKNQESRVKSQETSVKSQESKFKIRVRDKIQNSKVKKEIQHNNETSYLSHPSNNCHVTRNIPQVTYVFAILIV